MAPPHHRESFNAAAALERLPRFRQVVTGFGALVSAGFAGLSGTAILFAVFTNRAGRAPARWLLPAIGGGLLIVALFMVLVWLRLWFGPRPWLDRTINRIFWRSYGYLLLAVISLLVYVTRVLIR
jgi:hypothetical protein